VRTGRDRVLAVLAALGSALLVAIANVLQHRAGSSATVPRLAHVLRRPLWMVGAGAGVAGFALHVVALSSGTLALVQPLLVCGLLFALPLSHAIDRRMIRRTELAAAAAVVCGLALFQSTAHPTAGRSSPDLWVLGWCTAATVTATAVGYAIAVRSPRGRAAWLALCTGVGYGLTAALAKATVGGFSSHGLAVLGSWPPYAFVAVVAAAIALNQLAFNAGPLAVSLPILTIVDPLVSVAIGATAFGETVTSAAGPLTGQVIGFALMGVGVHVLCKAGFTSERSRAVVGPRHEPVETANQAAQPVATG
jgi:drug/metabolite transporter (DMT)-like permease